MKAGINPTLFLPPFVRSFAATLLAVALVLAPGFATAEEAPAPERLVIAFQKQKDPRKIQETADSLAAILTKDIGIPVEVYVPATYTASVQALASGKAHFAYMSAIPYLLARQEAPVEIALAEVRGNRTDYDSVFVVRKDSPYQTLADLKGARMMFTSATSTSGYVMAYSRLVDEKLLEKRAAPTTFFSEANFAGGYDRALLAVHRGQADVCAVSYYTVEGEKADVYSTPQMREELRVLTRTPGVPTHLICQRKDLPISVREAFKASILRIAKEQPALLSDVYGAATFKEVDEKEHLKGAEAALENTGLGLAGLVE